MGESAAAPELPAAIPGALALDLGHVKGTAPRMGPANKSQAVVLTFALEWVTRIELALSAREGTALAEPDTF